MELSHEKLLAAVLLWLLTFICSMLPIILVKKFKNENGSKNFRVMSFLSCFGGGVFLATCLLHLFPDVQDQMALVFKKLNCDQNYPIAEFLLGFGFLAVLIIEQIVLSCQQYDFEEKIPVAEDQHSHIESYQNYGAVNEHDSQTVHAVLHHEDNSYPLPAEGYEAHTHEVSFHQDRSSHSILRSLLLVFALSLHSIFEGLAIGLQSSSESVIKILLAVLIHKCIIAFTLGLNLTHSKLKQSSAIKGNFFFSLTSPVGIIIGLVVMDFVKGFPMLVTSGILQGIAAGTFLYVTFFEVLPHELNSNQDRIIKTGCIVLGFTVVSLLLIILPD